MKRILLVGILSSSFLFANGMHQEHKKCDLSVKKLELSQAPKQIMYLMHAPMMCEKFVESGNIDRDYLANMIPHHLGAVLSSKAVLEYSNNEKVREFAKNIISSQEKEIKEFKELLSKMKDEKSSNKVEYKEFVNTEKADMNKMMKDMSDVKLSSNIDDDYLMGMIPHHQGAIDASKNLLKYSKNQTIREIAQRIIQAQEKEIEEFKEFLSKSKN